MAGEVAYFDRLIVQKDGVTFIDEVQSIAIDLVETATSGGSQIVSDTPEPLDIRDVTPGGILRIWNHSPSYTISIRATASATNGVDLLPGERSNFRTAEGSTPYLVSPDGEARISFRLLDDQSRLRTELEAPAHECTGTARIGCSPIHVWRMDEASGVTAEDSVRDLDGTHSASDVANHDGAIGQSARYHDGDSDQRFTSLGAAAFAGENLDSTKAMTVSFWVKSDDTTEEGHAVSYLTGYTDEADYQGWSFGLDNGKPYAHFQRGESLTVDGSPDMPAHECDGDLGNGIRVDGLPEMPAHGCNGTLTVGDVIVLTGTPTQPRFYLPSACDEVTRLDGDASMAAHIVKESGGSPHLIHTRDLDGSPTMPAHILKESGGSPHLVIT